MFLERPESHRIRLSVETAPSTPREGGLPASATTSAPPTPTTLFQLGEDGPVALARASLENLAFDRHRDRFYLAESVQKDPPKGNFTAVARERTSGVLLGPPNHHSYQANLRALYEGRFSRRMGFEEFRRGVEIVNDPALVERWKEEVRTVTTYTVRDTLPPGGINKPNDDKDAQNPPPSGTMPAPDAVPTAEAATTAESAAPPESVTPEPVAVATSEPSETAPAPTPDADRPQSPDAPKPVVFENLGDVRTHFRQHYFDGLLRSGPRLELPGPAGRQLPEASLTLALRLAHERELKYPAGLVQPLRVGLQNTGLHIFKHRKRVVYVSVTRPVPFRSGGEKGGAVSEGVAAILEAIAARPMLSGKDLAARVLARRLGPEETKAAEAPPTVAAAPALTPGESAPPVGATAASESAFAAATPDGADAPGAAVESTPTPIPGSTDPSTVAAAPAGPDASPRQEAVAKARAALAADLRYLVGAGHVIAFHNGTFDLPLPPRPKDPPRPDPAPPINAGGEQPPAPPADTLASTAADTTGEEVPQEVKAATVADGDRERNPAAEEEVAAATDPTTPAAEEGVPTSPTPVAQKVGESSDTATSGEPGV